MNLFKKIAALSVGLAMAVGVGVAAHSAKADAVRADNATITPSDFAAVDGGTAGTAIGGTVGDISITAVGTNTSDQFRVFKNKTMVVSAPGKLISSIEITCTANGTTKQGPGCWGTGAPGGYTYESSGKHGTWEGSAEEVSFTATDNQVRITNFVITYSGGSTTTFTINYDSNGGSGSMEATTGANPAVAECIFQAPQGKGFKEWNTANDGSGITYEVGAKPGADLDLYAIWSDLFTISYNANGGSGEMPSSVGANPTVAECTFVAPSGMIFDKWNTADDGSGITYEVGAKPGADLDLYAIWKEATAYTLVTDSDSLVEGTQFILLHSTDNSMAIGGWNTSYFTKVSTASVSGSEAICEDAMVFTLEGSVSEGVWNVKCDNYYYGLQDSTAALRSDSKSSDDNFLWTISISEGVASMKTAGSGSRSLCYNSSATRFSAYTASNTYTEVRMFAIFPELKPVVDTRLTDSSGSIRATVGDSNWTVSGFVFEVQYEGESEWKVVSPTYVVTESVPTSLSDIGEYPVHFKVVFGENDYFLDTPFTAIVIDDATPISEFYTNLDTSKTYKYRGTVIGIEGNSYYLQQGDHGILIYGGTTTPPEGMKIGDLVQLTSKVQNYKNFVIENNDGANTAKILGTGSLPAAPIVTTVDEFDAHNQSTRVTFNGLSVNGESINWESTWASKSSDAKAVVKDSTNATIKLVVSKYLDDDAASAIITKINTITINDTFDLFQGVKVVSTSDGSATLSVMSAENITIHTPEEDYVQTWIDSYMQMSNPDFDGKGSGACKDSNYYVNAKAGLKALEEAHPGSIDKFQEDSEGIYAAALERYLAWAVACNDAEPFDGNDSVVSSLKASSFASFEIDSGIIIGVASAIVVGLGVGFFFAYRKKKQD